MIVDTSAIVGVVYEEDDRDELRAKLEGARSVAIGAPTLVETEMVLTAKVGEAGPALLNAFMETTAAAVVPFDEAHYRVAADAWLKFGKGRRPARLNFGDCLAYAVAKVADEPLLCKGGAFAKTDVALA